MSSSLPNICGHISVGLYRGGSLERIADALKESEFKRESTSSVVVIVERL